MSERLKDGHVGPHGGPDRWEQLASEGQPQPTTDVVVVVTDLVHRARVLAFHRTACRCPVPTVANTDTEKHTMKRQILVY